MAKGCCSQSHRIPPQSNNPDRSRSQMTHSSRRHVEFSYQTHEEDFSSSRSPTWLEQPYASIDQSHPDETASSSRGKWKRGQRRGSHLSDTMRSHLGPQDQWAQAFPCISDALKAWLGQPKQEASPSFQPSQPKLPVVLEPTVKAPLGFISRRLDDMLSTPFDTHIISYKSPKRFLVPKFTMYDGTRDPFDHLLHYQQLMTLGIENDVLLYKVFPANLHGLTLSWFHHLPQNSINSFRDFSEAFFGHYLCSACQKKNISTLQNIKMQENKSLRDFMKRFEQAVLQVESYNMDTILQVFKRSISLDTPFFKPLAKNSPTSMNDLFTQADKYVLGKLG